MKLIFKLSLLTLLMASCTTKVEKVKPKKTIPVNNHSFSNIEEVHTTHLHLDLNVDFTNKKLSGVARHKMDNQGANQAVFDIKGLKIQKVTTGNSENEKVRNFEIGPGVENTILGQPLIVNIDKNTAYVNIYYETTEESEALDWLDSALTSSKNKPFLYTQGQAILTRTWIPIQDAPSNRITYSADLKVPSDLMAVMSASNPIEKNNEGNYHFDMKQPIPCYLIALAVGDLVYGDLGNHTGVYCEPELLEASMYEFEDLPNMMEAAEKLYGKYAWDQYDLLILPYSFPFGGMENPRLTFANPTLLAGDRSLVSVVAHELAHSWSGNLVTNETWNDFWLNEGFTVYFENRIMEEIIGKNGADNLALIEFFELQEELERIENSGHPEDAHLFLDLDGRDPDDGMTDVAYVKGAFFLKTLEAYVGRDKMDVFLKSYFDHFKFTSVNTDKFVSYLEKELLQKYNIDFNYKEWIYQPGIPESCINLKSDGFENVKDMAITFANGETDENWDKLPFNKRSNYSVQEWLTFIRHLPSDINVEKMTMLDNQLAFSEWTNAEIQFEWFMKSVSSNYANAYPYLESFLEKIGRRKFILPLYEALYKNVNTRGKALEWFKDYNKNYHAVSSNSIAEALEL